MRWLNDSTLPVEVKVFGQYLNRSDDVLTSTEETILLVIKMEKKYFESAVMADRLRTAMEIVKAAKRDN
jgi:outer membrane lipopolysaccharide assembly protein LptE/RlpB